MHANEPEMADKWEKEEESVNLSEGNKFDDVYKDYGFEVEKKSGGLTYWAHYGSDISGHKNSYIRGELSGWTDGKKAAVGDDRGRQSFSNPKAMAKWFEKNFKMKKESVNEGKLDRIGSQLIKDLDKKYKNQKGTISTFNKIKKDLRKKMPRVSDRVAGSIANQYNDFLLDKDLNPKEKLRLMVLTLKGLGMNEFVSEDRDYKAEYKKFQSSTKAKKYRAELNKYNRQKGTYGNGDGKDASHKGGKIVGFEAQSKNRGRAEKSRLKKEARTINVEPNWEGVWRYFKYMAQTNPAVWKRMQRNLGSEWGKLEKMAQQKRWQSESVNEGKYHDYKNDESLTAKQKIGYSMREVRDKLTELDKLVKMNVRLKNEIGVDSTSYWKRTHTAMKKISERLVKLANKVGQLY